MKKINILGIITIILLMLMQLQIQAQITLPYYSGFDNSTQQDGWVEYKAAATQYSHWGYDSYNSYSESYCVSHSYSPSTGITLTDNWYVSPGFSIPNGGKLDSIRYKFGGYSTPENEDTIGIYILTGSQNPSMATSKTLLFDFRDNEYIADYTYKIKTDITLPSFEGISYFAIRYRNSDCSTKWLSVYFDNIAISGTEVGISDYNNKMTKPVIYPNPTTGNFTINHSGKIESITIQNELAQTVYQITSLMNNNSISIDLSDRSKGLYIIKIREDGKIISRKIIVQ